ncbi:EIF3M-like protein [Mya arenaria]|uniref:EIF3M-like protein n=1 Tax=Mya arenaria TaxID=6604 RepID=A0ABY7DUX5_MYAAR|nr:EIF3M-like protein [Mya arenaria]
MSIPTFIDIEISDQTSELRAYLKELGAEISAENTEDGVKDLRQCIEASNVCWKEGGPSDSEIEMVFNGLISLLLMQTEQSEDLIQLFCKNVSQFPKGDKKCSVRLRILSNLFHGLPEKSSQKADVYLSLLLLSKEADLASMVITDITQATKVMIELLGTYTEDNASQARDDAQRCIVTCLEDPNTFLLDHLLTLKPVKFLEGALIHDLLTIFVTGKLSQYQQPYPRGEPT